MIVLIQVVGWLACGILAVLALIIMTSSSFRDDKGDLPFLLVCLGGLTFIAAVIGAISIVGIGQKISEDMDRANTQQLIEDLRRSAKGY